MPTRIVLADDHALVRQGIKSLLEREGMQVVGEASDGREAIRLAEALSPDVVVMDIGMPTLNGMEAARELARTCPKVKPILLTQHDEPQYVSAALSAGVKGYVLKSQISAELIHAIRQVLRGHVSLRRRPSRVQFQRASRGSTNLARASSSPTNRRRKIHQRCSRPLRRQRKNR